MSSVVRFKFAMLGALLCLSNNAAFSQVELRARKVGADELTILKPLVSDTTAEFCTVPPDKSNADLELAIAAAFTTKTATISGLSICEGKKISGPVNVHLGAVAVFLDGNFSITSADHGKILTPDFIAAAEKSGVSLFQQYLLVSDGIAQAFRDKSLAPRRALVVFNNGDRGVVQSVKAMTLGQFSRDMQLLGVRNALYTPVGDGDGGWYRDGAKTVSIGKPSSANLVQSNWVVWKKSNLKHNMTAIDSWLQERNTNKKVPIN